MSAESATDVAAPLLRVEDLCVDFRTHGGLGGRRSAIVKAVDGVSFDIAPGETFGLVGESGCGKTTTGRALMRLLEPTAGRIEFDGIDVRACSRKELRALRTRIQIIFQDPYASLNPRMTVGAIVGEGLRVHGLAKGAALDARVGELLERVGLPSEYHMRYPHEFSGGQRQRIGIARALALEPDLIVCDEAVSALDVSIQAQVLNLLNELQQDLGLAYLFISHDLNVVRHIADRIGVMYLGRIVEVAPTERLFEDARHPYTRALIAANPIPDPHVRSKHVPLSGEVPSPLDPPSGCSFHPRCPIAMPACSQERPAPTQIAPGHVAHCLLADEPTRQASDAKG